MAGNPVKGEWFTILRAGEYPGKYPITIQDVQDMADDYDLSFRIGTVGLGHPNFMDSGQQPNLARIAELRAQGDELKGRLDNIAAELSSAFLGGEYPSWSGRIIPAFLSETGRMYLSGVDFLGVAQPAVAGMRVSFNQSAAESYCSAPLKISDQNPPSHQQETLMSVTTEQVKAELAQFKIDVVDPLGAQLSQLGTAMASLNQLNAKIDELSKRPSITAEELTQLKTTAASVTELKTQNEALLSAEADRAVADACRGIPAGHCPPEQRQFLKKLYTTDRDSFNLQKAQYDKLRPTFANLSQSLVPEGEGEEGETVKANIHPDAIPDTARIAQTALSLRKKDPTLSLEQATKMAAEGRTA